MNQYRTSINLVVREENHQPAKRINIVSIKLVRESSMLYKNRKISSPEDAWVLFKQYLDGVDREHFVVMALDTKNQPTAIQTCHIGSLNSSMAHPREIMKVAILSNAASLILGHNHPSNDPSPSQEDVQVTKRIVEAGQLLGIDVLDHIIVCDDSFVSLKEKGYV
jgi:DNA repair protein RadC